MKEFMLYRATGRADAYLLRAFLQQHGLPAVVRGEALVGLAGEIPVPDSMPTLWVAEERREQAEGLLARFRGPALVQEAWVCAHCNEPNEGNFEICWNCERDRP